MSDLRDAAELALTALENTYPNNWTSVKENLRKALAQPKREWVGLADLAYRLRKRAEIRRQIPDRKSVQEGEPDRIADLLEEAADALDKQWVGLTDEEVKDIVWNLPYEPSQEHIRAIEAKLKEKNT
jgi:hypothetical protein